MTSSFWIKHTLTLCLILIANAMQWMKCFCSPPPRLSLQQDWNIQVGFLFRWFSKIPGNYKVHSYFPSIWQNFWKNLWLPLLVNSQCQPMNGVVFHECFCSPPACACSGTGTWCSSSTWGTYSKHFLRAQGTNRAQTCCIVTRQMVPHYYACNLQVRP